MSKIIVMVFCIVNRVVLMFSWFFWSINVFVFIDRFICYCVVIGFMERIFGNIVFEVFGVVYVFSIFVVSCNICIGLFFVFFSVFVDVKFGGSFLNNLGEVVEIILVFMYVKIILIYFIIFVNKLS